MMIGAQSRMDDIAFHRPQDGRGFRERPDETLRRWALGVAYALRPNRIRSVPPFLAVTDARLLAGDRRRRCARRLQRPVRIGLGPRARDLARCLRARALSVLPSRAAEMVGA